MLKSAAILEIGGDPGRTERVIADRRMNADSNGPPADHAPGVGLRHRLVGQHGRAVPRAGAEQPTLTILGNAGRSDVGVQRFGEAVMAWHLMMLASFLVQSELPAGTLWPKVFHLHFECGGYAREGIGEGGDQRTVA